MNKFLSIFFCFILSGGGVGYVYVADQLETKFQHPTGHDIEAEMEQYELQRRFDEAWTQGGVEELYPEG